ncbi:MAG: nickel pincer cofactor biosynthesis protein LarC [Saprospiraceae bacterium]|nr:nickel pincer cofactor biosynthesis protein LarC [Saprospiraceae bacterium]
MTNIYIEAFSGLSGNMLLSAFCELFGDYELLVELPNKLHLPDGKVEIRKVNKNGISCKYVEVIDLNLSNNSHSKHAHDPEDQEHTFEHGHEHYHHKHSHDHGHHHHRHLVDIQKIIDNSHISDGAKKIAHDIFLMIGKAESKIHDMPLETIHFHEISGVDSIIDIVGNAVLIDKLRISRTFCTPICTGFGMVKTQHGLLPVPAPATAELLKGMPLYPGDEEGEKITPTGAAILRYLNPDFSAVSYVPQKTAYGPGKKDFRNPNVVRISLLEQMDEKATPSYLQIETSIDDMSPEYLGADFQQGLLDSGAIDFGISQQLMKKGRYAFLLRVIVLKRDLHRVSNYLFDHTSTIGLRYFNIDRIELQRQLKKKQTTLGEITMKETITPTDNVKTKPEFDDIKKLALKTNQSAFQVINKINNNI